MSSRPRISWSDLRSRRVGVWGLGVEGSANLRRARAAGAQTVLVDDDPSRVSAAVEAADHPAGSDRVATTASGGLDLLADCDVVVKTPGISRYRDDVVELERRGVPVAGGLGLWLEELGEAGRRRVACVTGTKGKSTTVAVCGHLLAGLGQRAFVGGNLGRPPWDTDAEAHDLWIVETSSFQATDVASSPPVVAVTSLFPDHIDWHGSVEAYYRDKLSLAGQPGADVTVFDGSSSELQRRRPALGPRRRPVNEGDAALDGPWVEALGLRGHHNRRNVLIARAVLQELGVEGAGDDDALTGAAEGFGGLESRLRDIGRLGDVAFVDDSLSTNTGPAMAALASFPGRRVAIVLGGHDRGIDYAPLVKAIVGRAAPTMAVGLPGAGRRVHGMLSAELAGVADGAPSASTAVAGDLEEAVRLAYRWARPDGVVLLSPAAPSFGQFRDYRERSAAFARAFGDLAAGAGEVDR